VATARFRGFFQDVTRIAQHELFERLGGRRKSFSLAMHDVPVAQDRKLGDIQLD